MNRYIRTHKRIYLVAGLAASLALIPASTANALQDSHEPGITYTGNWSTIAHSSAIGGTYVRASMAIEDATGTIGSHIPNSSLKFIPAASNWTVVELAAASGGSYMSNDGAPVLLTENTGTDGLQYGGSSAWYQGSMHVSPTIPTPIENNDAKVIYRYTDTSNVAYECTHATIKSGTNTCNGAFLVGESTTKSLRNNPSDHNTSIEVPFNGSNVTALFSIGTYRGKVDIEVRRTSDNTIVRSWTGFDTSTDNKAAFWGMGHDSYKLIIKGTGLPGAATPGYPYYFNHAQVYPSVEYQFFGPSIIYEGNTGPDYGMVNLYIDGQQEDSNPNIAGIQSFDLYATSSTSATIFSNTRDGTFSKSLGYSNGGNKHRILIEASGVKYSSSTVSSTGYKLALDKFRALPSISGTIPTSGSLNIATPAYSNLGTWKLFVDGKTEFIVDINSAGDKELNMFHNGLFTLRNFWVKGLSPGNREFSFVSKWYERDSRSSANTVTFDGITNASAEHTFTGTTISYIARKGPDQGQVKVLIDGTEQDADPVDSVVQPFELYAATEQLRRRIFTTSSLTNAQHTIRIEQAGTKRAESTGTGINLDAFTSAYPSSCAALLQGSPGLPSGTYFIDPDDLGPLAPYEVYCEMTTDHGGWTLALVASSDGTNTWTWQKKELLSTDRTLVGSISELKKDFKSAAHHDVKFSDLLFVHAPSGIWAAYANVGNATLSFANFMANQPPSPACEKPDRTTLAGNGYHMTAGTLTATRTATPKLCDTDLYFHLGDFDGSGVSQCKNLDSSVNDATYGPAWSMNNNNGCPFDDPSQAGLGPSNPRTTVAWGMTETFAVGFGFALNANAPANARDVEGKPKNYFRVFVR